MQALNQSLFLNNSITFLHPMNDRETFSTQLLLYNQPPSDENDQPSESWVVHDRTDDGANGTRLCGIPGICMRQAANICSDIPLLHCDPCGETRAYIFVAMVSIAAVLILICNSLVIFSVFCGTNEARSKLGYAKSSLALADMMNAFQIFSVVLPSFTWTMTSTMTEISDKQIEFRGSRTAFIGGLFFTFTYASSLYHLLLISLQRFIAVQRPIYYRTSGNSLTFSALIVVWAISILVASIPVWFPECFVMTYLVMAFIYVPAFRSTKVVLTKGIIVLTGSFLIPYIMTSVLTLATGMALFRGMRKQRRLSSSSRVRSKTLKRHFHVVKTLAYMELGFTVTLLPSAVVALMYYVGALDCNSISIPYLTTFYLSASNSLVNVVVYSFRDDLFQQSMKDLKKKIGEKLRYCFGSTNENEKYLGSPSSERSVKTSRTSIGSSSSESIKTISNLIPSY